MTTDTHPEDGSDTQETANEESQSEQVETAESSSEEIGVPEFQELAEGAPSGGSGNLSRIQNIQIAVTAELGRSTIPIQELMSVSEGSVIQLDREIDNPIELYAQGVPLASGEVVVVDGRFAVQITKVYENNPGQS